MDAAVVCSHPLAADAGRAAMMCGGNAVDAAITTALMLSVIDPANCGLGGYGGAMLVQASIADEPELIDFNTRPPSALGASFGSLVPRCAGFMHRGPSVAPFAVAPGLLLAHQVFGKRDWASLVAPAIAVARDGFPVGANLLAAIDWLMTQPAHASGRLAELVSPGGHPLREGDVLVQSDLARTLQAFAENPQELISGAVVRDACQSICEDGGILEPADMRLLSPRHAAAEREAICGLQVFGATRETTGFGILADGLAWLNSHGAGRKSAEGAVFFDNASRAQALQWAWARRRGRQNQSATQHTTHFCVADSAGMLVSCTFTHGPLWFGSGLVAGNTGLIMNCGMNLMRSQSTDGDWRAVNNLSPVIAVRSSDRMRLVAGSPGGSRIPAIVMQIILDHALAGVPLDESIRRPRLAVRPDGRIEAEDGIRMDSEVLPLYPADFFGPASAIAASACGRIEVASDHRFAHGIAFHSGSPS